MEIKVQGDSVVPILFTHKSIVRPPTLQRQVKFVGIKQGLKNLVSGFVGDLLERVHESFWKGEVTIIDEGKIIEKNYSIDIEEDRFDHLSPQLIVSRVDNDIKPAAAIHIESTKVTDPTEIVKADEIEEVNEIAALSRSKKIFKRPTDERA